MAPRLPPFTPDGVLPRGDYMMTLHELKQSMLVTGGTGRSSTWDATWRGHLVDNLVS